MISYGYNTTHTSQQAGPFSIPGYFGNDDAAMQSEAQSKTSEDWSSANDLPRVESAED